jgi:hypothetical protein
MSNEKSWSKVKKIIKILKKSLEANLILIEKINIIDGKHIIKNNLKDLSEVYKELIEQVNKLNE